MTSVIEKQKEIFVTGLRNAHALETEAMSIMRAQVSRLEHYPELEARLKQHMTETEQQKDRLETILDGLGESRSALKDMAASIMGSTAAMSHAVAGDEILKNSFADFAFENFEIASYRSLITMAKESGHLDAVPLLEKTLAEEEAMAKWLEQNLPAITSAYLARETRGDTAKR